MMFTRGPQCECELGHMPSTEATEAMVRRRRAELLASGHRPGLVKMGMEWAVNSANGMEQYFKDGGPPPGVNLFEQLLPKYLEEAEQWIKAFEEG